MQTQIDALLDAIAADYHGWWNRSDGGADTEIRQEMIAEFNASLRAEHGRKYIKVLKENSVWGFIVAVDNDKKFKKGDILKAASYKTPERNAARGNILTGYSVNWTGPAYLGTKQVEKSQTLAAAGETVQNLKNVTYA